MMYKVEYIQRYNGNWSRWEAEPEPEHGNYKRAVEKNRTKVVDALMKALENQVSAKAK